MIIRVHDDVGRSLAIQDDHGFVPGDRLTGRSGDPNFVRSDGCHRASFRTLPNGSEQNFGEELSAADGGLLGPRSAGEVLVGARNPSAQSRHHPILVDQPVEDVRPKHSAVLDVGHRHRSKVTSSGPERETRAGPELPLAAPGR